MSFTHTTTWGVKCGSEVVENSKAIAADLEKNLDASIPDASADLQVNYDLDVSATKSFFITSDKAITVKTNSASTPDDTLTLPANEPYQWNPGYEAFLLTVDVVALFVTNASGATGNLKIRALVDPTP